ncbi:hypothetical protein D3C87_279720 [compost metagenome]
MKVCNVCLAKAKREVPQSLQFSTCGICGDGPVTCAEFNEKFNFVAPNWDKDVKGHSIISPDQPGEGFYLWLERGHPKSQDNVA